MPSEEPGSVLRGDERLPLGSSGLSKRESPPTSSPAATGGNRRGRRPVPGVRSFTSRAGGGSSSRESAFASLDLFVERSRILIRGERIEPGVVSRTTGCRASPREKLAGARWSSASTRWRRASSGARGRTEPLSSIRRGGRRRWRGRRPARLLLEYDLAENGGSFRSCRRRGWSSAGGGDRFRLLPPRVARVVPRTSPGRDDLPARRPEGRRKNTSAAVDAFRAMRAAGRAGGPLVAGQEGRKAPGGTSSSSVPCARRHADAVRAADVRRLPVAVRIVRPGAAGGAFVGRAGRRAGGDVLGDRIRSEAGGWSTAGGAGPVFRRAPRPRVVAELRARCRWRAAVAAPFTWERCTASWESLLASVSTPGSPR